MRVLHLDSGLDMRGGQWQCLHLASSLGNGTKLLAPAGSPLAGFAAEKGVETESLNIARLAKLARTYDLIHAHDARSHTWAVAVGGAPVVVSRRVAFPIRKSPVSRWKYSRPVHYIAVSECVKQSLLAGGVPADKISIVYDGVPLPAATATPDRIVALDTPDPMKGAALVKQAAAVGNFAIHFSANLDQDLPAASLFVYITHAEGLGSAALLAQAWGVPVVASRVGGLPEVVQDGATGVLTENNPDSIAAAMKLALSRREEFAANARGVVMQRFTVDHMVESTRQVYRKVLAC